MSFLRSCVYESFAGGVLALSVQLSGGAYAATPSPILLVADQSSSSGQNGQEDSRRGRTGTVDAESSGKIQSERDTPPGGGKMDNPNSKMDGKSGRGQGSDIDPGLPTPSGPGSRGLPSPSSGTSSMGGGSGMSSGGGGGGGR